MNDKVSHINRILHSISEILIFDKINFNSGEVPLLPVRMLIEMQYYFTKVKGRLVAVITDPEDIPLFKKELVVENLKNYKECTIDNGMTRDIVENGDELVALISKDRESLLGEYDLHDLRLYAKKKPKVVEVEYEGFE